MCPVMKPISIVSDNAQVAAIISEVPILLFIDLFLKIADGTAH